MYISNLNLFPELQIHISNCQLDIFTCMFNRPMPNQNALRISVSCPDGIQRLDLTTTTSSTPILYNQQNKVWEIIASGLKDTRNFPLAFLLGRSRDEAGSSYINILKTEDLTSHLI